VTRADVGEHCDRSQVLRVDHLGAAGHLENEVFECGAHHHVARPLGGFHRETLGCTDHVGVSDEAGVTVELSRRLQRHQIAAFFGVNEEHTIADGEG